MIHMQMCGQGWSLGCMCSAGCLLRHLKAIADSDDGFFYPYFAGDLGCQSSLEENHGPSPPLQRSLLLLIWQNPTTHMPSDGRWASTVHWAETHHTHLSPGRQSVVYQRNFQAVEAGVRLLWR